MSDSTVSVSGLGKSYRIGSGQSRGGKTFREAIVDAIKLPYARFSDPGSSTSTKEFWALRDVNIDVNDGEVVGIIGSNGAGKSTLLKILSGITPPSRGRVTLRGRVSSLLEVGTGFHPELTGRENVYLNGAVLGMRRKEITAKFDAIVEYSGVEMFLETPVKRYSSGMRVRLAFAVAAFLEPEILIVDEVLAVGDAAFQKKCIGRMSEIGRSGRTVIFVSHNMAAVEALCTRGVLIGNGTVICDGPVEEAVSKYAHINNPGSGRFNADVRRNMLPQLIRGASVSDETGSAAGAVRMGSPVTIRVDYQVGKSVLSPSIAIGVDDLMGRRIFTLQNPLGSSAFERLTGAGSIECELANLPLAPGEYSVTIAIAESGQNVETVENALQFSVLDSSIYNGGQSFHAGLCFATGSWKCLHQTAKMVG